MYKKTLQLIGCWPQPWPSGPRRNNIAYSLTFIDMKHLDLTWIQYHLTALLMERVRWKACKDIVQIHMHTHIHTKGFGSRRVVSKIQTLTGTNKKIVDKPVKQLLGKKRKTKSEGKGEAVHLEPTLGSCFLCLHGTLWGVVFCGLSGRGG